MNLVWPIHIQPASITTSCKARHCRVESDLPCAYNSSHPQLSLLLHLSFLSVPLVSLSASLNTVLLKPVFISTRSCYACTVCTCPTRCPGDSHSSVRVLWTRVRAAPVPLWAWTRGAAGRPVEQHSFRKSWVWPCLPGPTFQPCKPALHCHHGPWAFPYEGTSWSIPLVSPSWEGTGPSW